MDNSKATLWMVCRWFCICLLLSSTADATPLALIGFAEVTPVNPAYASSCPVLLNRLLYQHVREQEERDLVSKIRSPQGMTRAQLQEARRILDRMRSMIPARAAHNSRIMVEWDLSQLDPQLLSELSSQFDHARKHIRVANTDWVASEGYLPDDLVLEWSSGENRVRLQHDTNPVDACFGQPEIMVEITLADGTTLELESLLLDMR